MKGRARCRRCVALGLLASALIHAAAAGWWLRDWGPPRASLSETRVVELDLSMFGPLPDAALTEPTPVQTPAPELAASAPETLAAPPPPAEPEPLPEPEPEPEPPSRPADEPEALAEQPPEPEEPPIPPTPAEPAPPVEPVAAREPELQPPEPAKPKPQLAPKPPEKRPVQRSTRPKQETQEQATRPKRHPETKPPRRTEVVEVDPRAKTAPPGTRSDRPGPAGPSASRTPTTPSPGGATATRSAGKAEAAYLAELQRAIARHQRFPDDARKRHKTGVATLSFVVQRDGRIRQVRLAKSSGDASLDEAALQAMQRLSRFKPIPAVIDRQEWAMRVPIRFDLR